MLGAALHHGPTAGGVAERGRFFEQYAQTLRSYETVFGPAPVDLWPDAQRRLIEDPRARRVHPRDGIIVPRAALTWFLVVTAFAGLAVFFWWRS